MASDGFGDEQECIEEQSQSAVAIAATGPSKQIDVSDEAGEAHSDQPSSLTDNLSQRVQDEVGAENEKGADGDDPNNYPLHSSWSFWFDRSSRQATAQDFFANLRQVCTIKTIKAFWCMYNNVTPVEQLKERESYHLMRGETRRPVWEDLDNIDGGFWAFKVSSEDTQTVWLELLLAAIGEQFSSCVADDDEVCGISVKIRGFSKNTIQIWNVDSDKHHDARVIQKIKSLIPNVEINEYYQSSKLKMQEHVNKPPRTYRSGSPPQFLPPHRYPTPHPHGIFPSPHYAPHPPRYPLPPPGTYPHHLRGAAPGPKPYHSHPRPSYRSPPP